jgi:acyl-CoA synthetase (AMP-forming)/AMP-acid ligase II
MRLLEQRASSDIALIDAESGLAVSYRQLFERADSIAGRIGTDKSLVFVLARNDLLAVHVYAAVLRGGHAMAFLDGTRPVAEYGDLISAYRPAWLAGPEGTAAALVGLGEPPRSVEGLLGGEFIRLSPPTTPSLHPDLAVLLATSGTTGSRRYVRLSRRNIDANATSIADCLELDAAERPITSLPLHYSFGLSVLNSHWLVGASVVLSTDSVMQPSFWRDIHRYRCSSLAGVPYTYMMLERVGYRQMRLPSVRTMQQAGGPLDLRLTRIYAEHMTAKGGRLFVMYGQTEATARMAYVPPGSLVDKLGSAGTAIPGGRFWIDGLERIDFEETLAGEIVYEGPNVMMGYASAAADLAEGDDLHGVLRTGDTGYLDADGFLYVVGRSKRMAKVYGVRISLDELERSLQEHGPAAVVGSDDAILAYCAFGTDESLERLRRDVARHTHINKEAIRLRRVDGIPMSSSGKVDYRLLESKLDEQPA